MTNLPLISIILPLYREWHFLDQAIASVKAQTYTNFECLCLDDGSGNEMVAKAKAFVDDDPRFQVLAFPNAGVAATRNRGLDLAKGEMLTFLDQDDCYHPCFLERMLQALMETGADCAVCQFQRISGEDRYCDFCQLSIPQAPVQIIDNPLLWTLQAKTDIYNVWQKLYRRSVLSNIHFDTELFGSDDFLFTCESAMNMKRIVFLDEPLHFYRKHSTCVTRSRPMKFAFAQLNLLPKLQTCLAGREASAFRKLVYQKAFSVVRDYRHCSYSPEEHRALAKAVLETLHTCGFSIFGWSLRKLCIVLKYYLLT